MGVAAGGGGSERSGRVDPDVRLAAGRGVPRAAAGVELAPAVGAGLADGEALAGEAAAALRRVGGADRRCRLGLAQRHGVCVCVLGVCVRVA